MYPLRIGLLSVALRKESVDRNCGGVSARLLVAWSLSARRAWIEIEFPRLYKALAHVALRKESVDRNYVRHTTPPRPSVALRKESVDRNEVVN